MYAVFLTTFTHWAILWDVGLWYFIPADRLAFWLLLVTIVFSKVVKLVPLLLREPLYVLLIPVSVVFGHLHGLIKLYAALSLNVVSK